eukprot:g47901.t1
MKEPVRSLVSKSYERSQGIWVRLARYGILINKIVYLVSFVGNGGKFIIGYKAMIMDMTFLYHIGYIVTSVLGLFVHEFFYSILELGYDFLAHFKQKLCRQQKKGTLYALFDLIYREETLFNVIKSVTRNGRSILLTAVLALILVYLFSIVGFLFLKDDFILDVERLPSSKTSESALEDAYPKIGDCMPLTTGVLPTGRERSSLKLPWQVYVVLKAGMFAANNGLFKVWRLFEGEKWREYLVEMLIVIDDMLKSEKNVSDENVAIGLDSMMVLRCAWVMFCTT